MSSRIRLSISSTVIESTVRSALRKGSRRGMHAAMDFLATESKKEVPLRDGPLRDSCAVSVSDSGMTGCCSYDTPYAVVQHENMQFQHQRGRKAKYLEDPLNDDANQRSMMQLLQRECEKEF